MKYSIGTYTQKDLKTKRAYIRKNQFNKTYRKGKTLRTKATELFIRNFLITGTIGIYLFAGAYHIATATRIITIDGGGAMVSKVQAVKQAPQEAVAVSEIAIAPEIDWSEIPYIKKDKGTVEERIKKAFPEDPNTALAIAKCESGLDKNVIGDKHTAYCSVGLMQIRTLPDRMSYYGLTIEKLKNVDKNLEIARLIKNRFGWQPWSCWTSGEYKKHL